MAGQAGGGASQAPWGTLKLFLVCVGDGSGAESRRAMPWRGRRVCGSAADGGRSAPSRARALRSHDLTRNHTHTRNPPRTPAAVCCASCRARVARPAVPRAIPRLANTSCTLCHWLRLVPVPRHCTAAPFSPSSQLHSPSRSRAPTPTPSPMAPLRPALVVAAAAALVFACAVLGEPISDVNPGRVGTDANGNVVVEPPNGKQVCCG